MKFLIRTLIVMLSAVGGWFSCGGQYPETWAIGAFGGIAAIYVTLIDE